MPRLEIEVAVKDQEAWKLLDRISGRVSDMTPGMKEIGETVRRTVSRKGWVRVLAEQGQTLSNHSLLRQGINIHAERDRVAVGICADEVGVRVFGIGGPSGVTFTARVKSHIRYLKTGKRVQVKAHTRRVKLPRGDIPDRPYLMVQPEDWDGIREELTEYLLKI